MFLRAFFRRNSLFLFVLGGGLLLCACRQQSPVPADAVARVGDVCLTRAELEGMMPSGMLRNDSLDMVEKKISAWVSQQVLLRKARHNLDERSEREIEAQIEQYRNSLVIFSFENRLIGQLLDTVVSDKEIERYYKDHQQQFILKSNIVRVRFVKMPKGSKEAIQVQKELFASPFEEKNLVALADLCRNGSENFFLDDSRWLFFNDLLREIPIQTYNQEDFLKNNRNIEVEAGDYVYYVSIVDFKIRDMVSPISFEKERIRTIILNQRRKTVRADMERDLMEEARTSGLIEYY